MYLALQEAKKAYKKGEVPVGCVIVREGKVLCRAHNLRERKRDPILHAEMLAIRKAARRLRGWRLTGCTLYVTLEPCPMCAGAMINARIDRVVYGAADSKAGCFGSIHDFSQDPFNHSPEIVPGVLREECASILKAFFSAKRKPRPESPK